MGDLRAIFEKFHGFFDTHVENVIDILAFIDAFKGLVVITHAVAFVALHVDVRKEVHRDIDNASALALLATSASDIEGEPSFVEAPCSRFWGFREESANVIEHLRVCGWVASWGPSDWLLVDDDDFVDIL